MNAVAAGWQCALLRRAAAWLAAAADRIEAAPRPPLPLEPLMRPSCVEERLAELRGQIQSRYY